MLKITMKKKVIYNISKDQNYWGREIGILGLHYQNVRC
jgi:hypothetical protein